MIMMYLRTVPRTERRNRGEEFEKKQMQCGTSNSVASKVILQNEKQGISSTVHLVNQPASLFFIIIHKHFFVTRLFFDLQGRLGPLYDARACVRPTSTFPCRWVSSQCRQDGLAWNKDHH